jgi:hypothetical protein
MHGFVTGAFYGSRADERLTSFDFRPHGDPYGRADAGDAAAMATTTVGSTMTVNLSATTASRALKLAYQPFFITGDMVADGKGGTILAGGYYDINNKPIIDKPRCRPRAPVLLRLAGRHLAADRAQRQVNGVKGKAVFAVVQFEYTTCAQDGKTGMYGKLPSPIAVLTLDQDQATGKLSLVKYHNVDTSGVNGLWITCGASLSPWGTHLSSEEYEPTPSRLRQEHPVQGLQQEPVRQRDAKANPYHYGHLPEVTVNPDGTGTIKKHYCLGRISHELVQVMPDNRTVLMGDDATNSGYFMFVADKEKDLSSRHPVRGQVGAGFSLDPAGRGRAADLDQARLATSAEISAWPPLKPTDIMDVKTTDPPTPATPRSPPTAASNGSS